MNCGLDQSSDFLYRGEPKIAFSYIYPALPITVCNAQSRFHEWFFHFITVRVIRKGSDSYDSQCCRNRSPCLNKKTLWVPILRRCLLFRSIYRQMSIAAMDYDLSVNTQRCIKAFELLADCWSQAPNEFTAEQPGKENDTTPCMTLDSMRDWWRHHYSRWRRA